MDKFGLMILGGVAALMWFALLYCYIKNFSAPSLQQLIQEDFDLIGKDYTIYRMKFLESI